MLQHGCCCVPAQIDSANVLTGTQTFSSPAAAATATKSLQLCPTLCDPIDGSPPGSSFSGILQARTLEWVAISFSNAWSEKWKWSCSVVSDSVWPHGLQPTRLLHPWDFLGKSTGVGCHCCLLPYGKGSGNFSDCRCDMEWPITTSYPTSRTFFRKNLGSLECVF